MQINKHGSNSAAIHRQRPMEVQNTSLTACLLLLLLLLRKLLLPLLAPVLEG